jgi:hypothetical protein
MLLQLKFYHFRNISVNKIISASIPSSQVVVISSNTYTYTITQRKENADYYSVKDVVVVVALPKNDLT